MTKVPKKATSDEDPPNIGVGFDSEDKVEIPDICGTQRKSDEP